MSFRSTEETLKKMAQITGKEPKKVARNFSRDVLKKLVKHTPVAKKKQEVWIVAINKRTGKPITKNGEVVLVPKKRNKKIQKETVEGRGFLKAAWMANFEKLGLSPSKSKIKVGTGAKELSDVIIKKSGNAASYQLINKVPYGHDVNYGSENNKAHHFMKKAENDVKQKWDETIEKIAKRKMEQWKKKQFQKLNFKL